MAGYRKLGRNASQRKAMLRSLATDTFKHGKIKTTVTRAKEAQSIVEKLITMGKSGTLHARRQAASFIYDKATVNKLFEEIAPIYKNREGGYTRIYKTDERVGDNAPMAILELIDYDPSADPKKDKKEAVSKIKAKAASKKKDSASKSEKGKKDAPKTKSVEEKAEDEVKEVAEDVKKTAKKAKADVKAEVEKTEAKIEEVAQAVEAAASTDETESK